MTCHGRAVFDKLGIGTSLQGLLNFDMSAPIGPLGPIKPEWNFSFTSQPPIFEGMPGLGQTATSADFVWSIPFCVFDDTQTPIVPSGCAGK
jgi:hypothetical protein